MASKPKLASCPVASPTPPNPLIAVVDELGALEKELAPHKAKIARVEILRKQIRNACADKPSTCEVQISGTRYRVIVGACGNQTVIHFAKLIQKIKAAAFSKFATCTISALEANVSREIFAEVTAIEPIGPRSLNVLELAPLA